MWFPELLLEEKQKEFRKARECGLLEERLVCTVEIAKAWRGTFGVDFHSDCLVSGNATVDCYNDGKQQARRFGSFHSCTKQEVKVKGGRR